MAILSNVDTRGSLGLIYVSYRPSPSLALRLCGDMPTGATRGWSAGKGQRRVGGGGGLWGWEGALHPQRLLFAAARASSSYLLRTGSPSALSYGETLKILQEKYCKAPFHTKEVIFMVQVANPSKEGP